MKALCFVFVALVGCASAPDFHNRATASSVGAADIGEIAAGNLDEAASVLTEAPDVVMFTIDSPGGSVRVGLAFIELMKQAQARGTVIHCTVDGMAASMAAVIFERCDVRLMKRDAALMFHTVSISGVEGNQWEIERLAQYMAGLNKRLAILASVKMRISLAEYEARVRDFDWWLGWEEAIAVGAADGLR
jgi:ATP-dependent protease ClpP protease subunit